jgi:hypothetical protein
MLSVVGGVKVTPKPPPTGPPRFAYPPYDWVDLMEPNA